MDLNLDQYMGKNRPGTIFAKHDIFLSSNNICKCNIVSLLSVRAKLITRSRLVCYPKFAHYAF